MRNLYIPVMVLSMFFAGSAFASENVVKADIKCLVANGKYITFYDRDGNDLEPAGSFSKEDLIGASVVFDLDYGMLGYPEVNPSIWFYEDDVVLKALDGEAEVLTVTKLAGGSASGSNLGGESGDPCE